MKILIVNNFYSPAGGTEKHIQGIAELLTSNGHEVYFFATNKPPLFYDNYKYKNYFPQYTDYCTNNMVNNLKYATKIMYNKDAKLKIASLLDVIRPDIVHFHNIYFHLTPSVLKPVNKLKIPIIMTLHDVRLVCPSGSLRLKDSYYCKNELCIRGNPLHCLIHNCKGQKFSRSAAVTAEALFKKIHKLYDKVNIFICPSQALKDLLIRSGKASEKLVVLNNFIDDSSLSETPEYSINNCFLYAGRLEKEKGVDLLIKAIAEIPEAKLVIAGTGYEETALKELASKIGANNVIFKGYLTGENLKIEYHKCIATIQPANWFENFPMTVLESFAAGRPVIASSIGGLPEMIENGTNGFLFKPTDKKELVKNLRLILQDKEFAIQMGKNARKTAEENYTASKYYVKLIDTYKSVL
jgi:glycosyltransferase involved in cell wall biosynthesis